MFIIGDSAAHGPEASDKQPPADYLAGEGVKTKAALAAAGVCTAFGTSLSGFI
jgi:hypothetical protein